MKNFEGFNAKFILIMVFSGILGSSAVLFFRQPDIKSLLGIITSIAGCFLAFRAYYGPTTKDINADFQMNISMLSGVENDLMRLVKYVQSQKKEINQSQIRLSLLKEEHKELRPVVEAEKKLVEAIAIQVNKRNRSAIIYGYLASFLFGVASSLLASYLFEILTNKS